MYEMAPTQSASAAMTVRINSGTLNHVRHSAEISLLILFILFLLTTQAFTGGTGATPSYDGALGYLISTSLSNTVLPSGFRYST